MSIFQKDKEGAFGPFLISYEQLKPHLLNPSIREHELILNIKKISENFTTDRSEISKYVLNENMVSSYAAFYLPTNLPKLEFLLSHLNPDVRENILNRELIDVGSGPGTFAFAFRSLRSLDQKKIVCIDNSQLMLSQAEKIMKAFFPKQEVTYLKTKQTS